MRGLPGPVVGLGFFLGLIASSQAAGPSPSPVPPKEIIFAGISGLPPRYIDTGPDKGLGWMEYNTHEIRKGMKQDGFVIKQEWMTPARIEHEIRIGSPICTYPVEWNHPEKLFGSKPDRLYTLALDFEEESGKFILFHKADQAKFARHLGPDGDLKMDRLLEDRSLKIALVRDKSYGRISKQLTTLNAEGDQVVRESYRDHVYLMMIRENRQLIEMLNAHRFDYIFADAIEDQDLQAARLEKDRFVQLAYETSKVKSLMDPELVRMSIVCGIHPNTVAALPFFNKWISRNRSGDWKVEKASYARNLDPEHVFKSNQPAYSYLAGRFFSQLKKGSADEWYRMQQRFFPELNLYPDASEPPREGKGQKITAGPLLWHLIYEEPGAATLLNEAQLYRRSILDADVEEKDLYGHNSMYPWDHRHLGEYFSQALQDKLRDWSSGKSVGLKKVSQLRWNSGLKKLTLFAGGVRVNDLDQIIRSGFSSSLESLAVFDAAPDVAKRLVAVLPPQLVELNLTNSSLQIAGFEARVKSLKSLRHLHLNSTQLPSSALSEMLSVLPPELESLSLGFNPQSWSLKAASIFGSRTWSRLKSLDLASNGIDNQHFALLQSGIPKGIEKLLMGGNFFSPRGLHVFFERPLPSLKALGVESVEFFSRRFPVLLPESVESFLSFLYPFEDQVFKSSPGLGTLDLADSASKFANPGLNSFIPCLKNPVEVLNLGRSGVTLETLRLLLQQKAIRQITRLDLSRNNLGDDAVDLLRQTEFGVEHLNLDHNFIHNRGVEALSQKWVGTLKGLNLSSNSISEAGTQALSNSLREGLVRLELGSVVGLDVKSLAPKLPQSLRVLNVSGNQLSDEEMEILVQHLPKNLYELDVSGSAFGWKGALSLAQKMPPRLHVLNLSRVPIGSGGLNRIARALPPTLTEFSLSDLSLESGAVRALADALPSQLRTLRLEGISWDDASGAYFMSKLPGSVQSLLLTGVKLGPKSVQSLGRHWPGLIKTLRLAGCGLGDSGLMVLSQSLPPTLEKIELSDNGFSDSGLAALASSSLEHCRFLDLSSNRFTARGLEALGEKKRNFKILYLTSCGLNPAALNAIGPKLLSSVRRLHIGNNSFSNASVHALLRRLSPETYKLYIPSVGLTYEGVEELIRLVPVNLQRLAIGGNVLGEKGFKKLEALAEQRRQVGPRMELVR